MRSFWGAYHYALQHSPEFRAHAEKVQKILEKKTNEDTGCFQFSVDGECFYYGFDGAEVLEGKHTPERSEYLLKTGQTLVIE